MGDGSLRTWFAVTFSQRTESLPLVKRLIPHLLQLGIEADKIFLQDNISDVDQESHWLSQWMGAQRASKVVVCVLTSSYLRSRPCCTEWKLVQDWQRLVICVGDSEDMMLEVELNGFNGPALAHLQAEEQILSMSKYTEEQLAMKIQEKYLANRDRSYHEDLRNRGAARRLSMGVGAGSLNHTPSLTGTTSTTTTTTAALSPASSFPSSSSPLPSVASSYPTASGTSPRPSNGSAGNTPPDSPPRPERSSPATSLLPLPPSEASLDKGTNVSPSQSGRHLIIKPANKQPAVKPLVKFTIPKNMFPETKSLPTPRALPSPSPSPAPSPSSSSSVSPALPASPCPSPSLPTPSSPPSQPKPDIEVGSEELLPAYQGFLAPPNLPAFFPPSPQGPPSLPSVPPKQRVSRHPPSPHEEDEDEDVSPQHYPNLTLLSPFVSRTGNSRSPA